MPGSRLTDREELETAAREIDALRARGAVVAVTPDEADDLGLFEETALGLEDALEARFDWDGPGGEGVALPVASAAEAGFPEAPSAAPETEGGEDGGGDESGEDEDDGSEKEGLEDG